MSYIYIEICVGVLFVHVSCIYMCIRICYVYVYKQHNIHIYIYMHTWIHDVYTLRWPLPYRVEAAIVAMVSRMSTLESASENSTPRGSVVHGPPLGDRAGGILGPSWGY